MPFQTPSPVKVGSKTETTSHGPALVQVNNSFLTAYVGEGGSNLYCAEAKVTPGPVKWTGNQQVVTVSGHKLESHRSPGLYLNFFQGLDVGLVYISTDGKSINQTLSPMNNLNWSDPQPLSDFDRLGLKWDNIFVSMCGFQTFIVAVDTSGGVWFSTQATWFDPFTGNFGTTPWTNVQKVPVGNVQVGPGVTVSKFDSWAAAICTDPTQQNQQLVTLYGFCHQGIAIFKFPQQTINETTNQLTVGNWSFDRFVPFKILSATACTPGIGNASSHRLFFVDTSPGGLLTVDVNPALPAFFQTPVTALKPGNEFSTDAIAGSTYFGVGNSGPYGYALVWKHSGGHAMSFSSELI